MANEISALVEACGELVDRLAITPAESMHAAIAGRVFRASGPLSAPVRLTHDGIAALSYGAVRFATSSVTRAAAAAVRVAAGGRVVRPLSRSPRGRFVISAVNGLIGDHLAARGSDLAIRMSIRRGGADLGRDSLSMATAWPEATSRVAVFVHGLGETEELWSRRTHEGRTDFGERLRSDLGLTPVLVRYNSGLPVAANGVELAGLLLSLAGGWPVRLTDLVLVGHSMGGLVFRAACEVGGGWTPLLRHVVTLGTPHTGAPIEKGFHMVTRLLRLVPETAVLAEVLDGRSAGIRDLRLGSRAALPATAAHTFMGATITREPGHPLGWAVGDLLVRTDSAAARHHGRGPTVPEESVVHLGGLSHFDLLDHPLVYQRLRQALAGTLD